MALWTPCAQKEPLDLSKTAVKSEDVSPRSSHSSPELLPVVTFPDPWHHYGYYYQPPMPYVPPAMPYVASAVPFIVPVSTPPASRISPDSTGGWCLTQPNPPSSTESGLHVLDTESLSGDIKYQAFKRDALQGLAERNGGSLVGENPRMKWAVQTSQSNTSYREQREKNNLAAKQSRDRRKLREIRLALQVSFLKK